ncbi:MAG TPA: flagellar filament capping protein FliD [Myxococcota bacterium]
MTTTTSSTDGTFRFGGLATGLDTNSIIDALTTAEKVPETKMQAQQSGIDVKVSGFGQLANRLLGLRTAVDNLNSSGLRGVKVTSSSSAFSVTATSHAQPGQFAVQVTQLAAAAHAMSARFDTTTTAVPAGTLTIGADGTSTDITIPTGATLTDVADLINKSGADVTANVLDTGNGAYLSVVRNQTGFTVGGDAAGALTFSGDGAPGVGLAVTTAAKNATFTVDDLPFERRSNSIDDAIPNASLTLNATSDHADDAVFANDSDATQANVQKFVDAYNGVIGFVQQELDVQADTDRDKTLAGESLLRQVQQQIQGLISQQSPSGTSSVRALADIGVSTGRDGTLTLNSDVLSKALARDGGAVDSLLSGTGGIADQFDSFVKSMADGSDSQISQREEVLTNQRKDLDDQIAAIDRRVETYKTMLVNQFSAMEQLVSGLNAQASALSALTGSSSSSSSKS